ncbi:enoyl-CoA hydratase [Rhizobium leguminosarum]|uniref:enoyl-CoA hydratase n=1 Tax=Rhizobium leguminosarum TaxID=384 RepID=UPI0021BBE624|nr:enoyl-CoA hydratase [Rhizobium leguminosarum]
MKTMDDMVVEHSEGVLRVELNRPEKMNAMTSSMYLKLADIFDDAAKDESVRVVLWHGAGDAFTAGNDVKDFLQNPPGAEESPQARLMNALVEFDKPLIAAVHGVAIGGGTTMLLHCDFVYAAEKTRFQMPFISLAVVPEFGSSCLLPQAIGHVRASDLILLGSSFDARRARELGLVTEVVPYETLLAVATETARHLAAKPAGALQASKRLLKQPFVEQIRAAMKAENEAFSEQVRSDDAKEALTAFLEKRPADFTKTRRTAAAD